MGNLIDSYWDNASFEVWVQLKDVLQSKQSYLMDNIENDDKPKRHTAEVKALENLPEVLSKRLDDEQKMAS